MGVRRERQNGEPVIRSSLRRTSGTALRTQGRRPGRRFGRWEAADFLTLERIEGNPAVRRVVIAVIGTHAAVRNGKEMDLIRGRIVDVAFPSIVIPTVGMPAGQGNRSALRRQIHAVVLNGMTADAGHRPQHRFLDSSSRQFRQRFNDEVPILVCHNSIALTVVIRQNVIAAIRYPIRINIWGVCGAFGKRRHGQQPYKHDQCNKQGRDPFSHSHTLLR